MNYKIFKPKQELFMIKAKFDTLYQTDIFEKKIRQNDVIQFLAFCLNAIFGNMSVHLTK